MDGPTRLVCGLLRSEDGLGFIRGPGSGVSDQGSGIRDQRTALSLTLPDVALMVGFPVSPLPPTSLGKNFGFMELPVRLRPKHDITKGLLTAVGKQKSYGPIFDVFPGLRCKHDITKGLLSYI